MRVDVNRPSAAIVQVLHDVLKRGRDVWSFDSSNTQLDDIYIICTRLIHLADILLQVCYLIICQMSLCWHDSHEQYNCPAQIVVLLLFPCLGGEAGHCSRCCKLLLLLSAVTGHLSSSSTWLRSFLDNPPISAVVFLI